MTWAMFFDFHFKNFLVGLITIPIYMLGVFLFLIIKEWWNNER
jgi:hypothetical protein